MIRFHGLASSRRARVVAVLAAVSAGIFAPGSSVVSSLASSGPAVPVISGSPPNPATSSTAMFMFTDSERGVRFRCSLDSGFLAPCASGISFTRLARGPHCFHLYATGRAGRAGPATGFCWTIGAAPQNFSVGGNLTSPLYPGTSQRLNLTFTDHSFAPISIPSGGISASNITIASHAPGCASSNFAVIQGLARAVTIPAHQFTPTSLSALGVPQSDWPVIEMIETNTNQDACQGAKLTLTYSRIEAAA